VQEDTTMVASEAIDQIRAKAASRNRLRAMVRTIRVPQWLGAEVFGVHLGPEVIDSDLRARWGPEERDYPDLLRRLLPSTTVQVGTPDDALSRVHRKSMEFEAEISAACQQLAQVVAATIAAGELPVIEGGDHSVSRGSLAGSARMAQNLGVIWIDSHADVNTPQSSRSGHNHGMPVAYGLGLCGHDGSDEARFAHSIRPENLCYLGLRDIDPAERDLIDRLDIWMLAMEEWFDAGIDRGLESALAHLGANGVDAVHVSFDVDVLDPTIMPGTGTRVDGGLNFLQASQVLRRLHNSGAPIRSVDFVELNPLLDQSGGSARVAVALLAALLGETMRSPGNG